MKVLLAASSGLVVLALAFAQQPAEQKPAPSTSPTPASQSTLLGVNVLFTVTDKKGRFITDLTKDDFAVAENKKPQIIQEFTAETDLPLRIAILIDTSNSIRDRFKFEQEAAIEFVNSVIRPRQDKAMLVSFDTAAELVADLSDDTTKLAKSIRDLRPGGGTALYDAIYFACRDRLQQDQPRHKFRPRDHYRQRWRRQPEPRQPRPGARDGAEGRCRDLFDLDQHLEDRK